MKKGLTGVKKAVICGLLSDALVAKLVDAHASGACCLRQWKFKSSPEHHFFKLPFAGAFFVLGIWFGLSAKTPSPKKTMAGERKLAAFAYADDK